MTRFDDRYDERNGPTKLYIGRLSSRTRSHDLEDLFKVYGRIREVDVKHDFAFIEFSDSRDADDARHYMNGKEVDGSRIIVEFARRGPRIGGGGIGRGYLGRGPPDVGKCYNCGNEGHWARDCKAGDWKDKCYRCGQRGHIERNCRNNLRPSSRSPRDCRKGRSRSRSRSRSCRRSPNRVNRSSLKDNRDRSLSPSPRQKDSQSRSPNPIAKQSSPHRSPLPHGTRRSASGSPGKCYRYGQQGHIERNRHNNRRPSSRYTRSISHSLSRSPRDRHKGRSQRLSRSQSCSWSPSRVNRSSLKNNREHILSPSPGQKDPRSRSPSPTADQSRPHHSPSPRGTRRSVSGSPRKCDRSGQDHIERDCHSNPRLSSSRSPTRVNGRGLKDNRDCRSSPSPSQRARSHSPSPIADQSSPHHSPFPHGSRRSLSGSPGKCYLCGQGGHTERNCLNYPRRSSRSPRDRHKRGSHSHSRSLSYSRPPNQVNPSNLRDNRDYSLSPSPGRKDSRICSPSPIAGQSSPHCSPLPHDTRRSASGSPGKCGHHGLGHIERNCANSPRQCSRSPRDRRKGCSFSRSRSRSCSQ